jgi:hypothetical protein
LARTEHAHEGANHGDAHHEIGSHASALSRMATASTFGVLVTLCLRG